MTADQVHPKPLAAMGYRKHEKELKQPDDFQKLGVQAIPWLEQHGKALVTAIVLVLGTWGVVATVNHFGARANARAAADLGTALKLLSRDVKPKPSAEAPPPVSIPGSDAEPAFTSEQEKDEALIKKLTEFRASNAGRSAAVTAALPLAQAYLRQDQPDPALPLLAEFLKTAEASDLLRAQALEARGYAYEFQSKYDDAIVAFDQLAKENRTDFLKGMGLYHRARMLQLKGDAMGAAKQFAQLHSAAAETAAARLAKDRLAILASQGIVPPAPLPIAAAVDAGV